MKYTLYPLSLQANVSIGRISAFLKHGDLDPDAVQHEPRSGGKISYFSSMKNPLLLAV